MWEEIGRFVVFRLVSFLRWVGDLFDLSLCEKIFCDNGRGLRVLGIGGVLVIFFYELRSYKVYVGERFIRIK